MSNYSKVCIILDKAIVVNGYITKVIGPFTKLFDAIEYMDSHKIEGTIETIAKPE